MEAPPGSLLPRLLPLYHLHDLREQSAHKHLFNDFFRDKRSKAQTQCVSDGPGLAGAAARVHQTVHVHLAQEIGELEWMEDLVPLFQAEEVGDVLRLVQVVHVGQAELPRTGHRHTDLGAGVFTLAW